MKRFAFFLSVALVASACDDDDDDLFVDVNGNGIPDDQEPTPNPSVIEWRAALVNLDPSLYALQGDAVVAQVVGDAAFTATITIRNDTPGAVRPWHVHFNTCAAGGGIVGADTAYPRLTSGTDGAASSNVMVRVGLDPAVAYHVNVHKSDAEFNTLIMCGDLIRQ
jgi:hypothetical protein